MSDKLTSEKLASIKTKIRTRKRGTIADTDIIHGTFSYNFYTPIYLDSFGNQNIFFVQWNYFLAKYESVKGDIQRLSENSSNNFERVWRTRQTILQCEEKYFIFTFSKLTNESRIYGHVTLVHVQFLEQ